MTGIQAGSPAASSNRRASSGRPSRTQAADTESPVSRSVISKDDEYTIDPVSISASIQWSVTAWVVSPL